MNRKCSFCGVQFKTHSMIVSGRDHCSLQCSYHEAPKIKFPKPGFRKM